MPSGGVWGLQDIRDWSMSEPDASSVRHRTGPEGTVRQEDVFPAFVDKVLSFIDVEAVERRRVVIDAANGMAGVMLPLVLERIPIEAVPYYFEPDGTFPN